MKPSKLQLPEEVRARIRSPQAPLRPARHVGEAARRAEIVEHCRAARQQIAQIFIDMEHWNEHVRRPEDERIDPDPDGDLRAIADFYDRILKNDTQ